MICCKQHKVPQTTKGVGDEKGEGKMKKILVLLVLVLMFLIGSSGFQKTGATAITDEERLLFAQEPGYDYILATRKGIWVLRGEVYRLSEYSVGLTDVDGFPKVPVLSLIHI